MKPTTVKRTRAEPPTHTSVHNALLMCGIVALPLYLVGHILAGMQLRGYSHIHHMVSELTAIGAPSAPIAGSFALVFDALAVMFGIGVWGVAGKRRSLRAAAIALVAYAVIGMLGAFVPMNTRGAERSATDLGHLINAAGLVLAMLLFMALGSGADGRWFRIYSILTIVATLASGAWTGTQVPLIEQGLPTPWGGAIERVSVYAPMLWMLVLAVVLLREHTVPEATPQATPQPTLP